MRQKDFINSENEVPLDSTGSLYEIHWKSKNFQLLIITRWTGDTCTPYTFKVNAVNKNEVYIVNEM